MHVTSLRRTIKLANMAGHLKSKRARLCPNADKSYFESYADITVHEEMLGDDVRTNTYKKAIFNSKHLLKDKVVLDVGAGTGILSCFCAQAGAKKVYAVEASSIAEQANKVVVSNGLEEQIEVIQGLLEDVKLPEKVDVIVSEWMGYCLLYESMLTSVLVARDRWLKPDGILLPNTASLYVAPICDDEIMVEKVNFWNDMDEVYGVDMSCLLPFARKSLSKEVMVKSISCENILSQPQLIAHFNLNKVTPRDIEAVCHKFQFSSFGIADFQGFAIWFDVTFPQCESLASVNSSMNPALDITNNSPHPSDKSLENESCKNPAFSNLVQGKMLQVSNNHIQHHLPLNNDRENQVANQTTTSPPLLLSTSPYRQETHWKQSLLYLDNEIEVVQDSLISGTISLTPCTDNHRFLNISMSCQVDNGSPITKTYLMGYELPNNKDKKD